MTDARPSAPPAETVDTIVFISVDSLRADRVHAEYEGVPLTPNIDSLAADAIEFSEGISPGPGTADSVPAMLTGEYPSSFPGFSLPGAGTEPRTLAERLADHGFESAAFNQNNLISRRYNFDRGFDFYYDISEETRRETGRASWRLIVRDFIEETPLMNAARWLQSQLMERFGKSLYVLNERGDSLTDRAIEWLKENGGNRFLWMHYMDAHHPYLSSAEVQREFGEEIPREQILRLPRKARSDAESLTEGEVERLEHQYNCAVRYVDEQIGRIVDHLEHQNELENTMIIVTADHGEEFLEHGEFGHRRALWDEIIRVPLVIWYPPAGQHQVNGQAPVQAIPETIVEGTGLFDLLDGGSEYVISETGEGREGIRSCRRTDVKLIRDDDRILTRIEGKQERIVDEDDIDPAVLEQLETQLKTTGSATQTKIQVDEEALQEDLAALGYLDE